MFLTHRRKLKVAKLHAEPLFCIRLNRTERLVNDLGVVELARIEVLNIQYTWGRTIIFLVLDLKALVPFI